MSLNNFGAGGSMFTKLLQTMCSNAGVITRVQLLEAPPQICEGQENVQILARFLTTFDFDREYLRNDYRYPKSERNVIDSDSSRILWKKSGELWSPNKKVLLANIEPPKWIFRGKLHLGPRGCCALKMLHALDIDQGYLANTPTGTGVPPKNFNREN